MVQFDGIGMLVTSNPAFDDDVYGVEYDYGQYTKDEIHRALSDAIHAGVRPLTSQEWPGLIHHTDRGGQYAGTKYRTMLHRARMPQSMSRADNCYDNGFMESCFGIISDVFRDLCPWHTPLCCSVTAQIKHLESSLIWGKPLRRFAIGYADRSWYGDAKLTYVCAPNCRRHTTFGTFVRFH